MADTRLRNKWLLDAEDAVGTDPDKQIEWLKAKRREYTTAIDAGDWETQSASGEAGSSTSRRGISDLTQHDAIVAALRFLGGSDLGGGSLLQVQFTPGVG
jgi:hypothetical protein